MPGNLANTQRAAKAEALATGLTFPTVGHMYVVAFSYPDSIGFLEPELLRIIASGDKCGTCGGARSGTASTISLCPVSS